MSDKHLTAPEPSSGATHARESPGDPNIDTLTVSDLRFNPPALPQEVIASRVFSEYGLAGEWQPMDGERDQNLRLSTGEGEAFVVKIAGPDEDPMITDFQVQALRYLEQGSPTLPVPRVVPTRGGKLLGSITDNAGTGHALRVVTYLPGIPYGEGGFPDPPHLQKIGAFMGSMVNALAGFGHPASRHFMPWNLANGVAVSKSLWANATGDLQALAGPLLHRLRNQVLPALNALPSQVIHNDGHGHNLLRSDAVAQEVSGIIDFGDMVYAPIVDELAVTATSFLEVGPRPLATIRELLLGFHRVHPLSVAEVSLLWDAIILRLLSAVLLSDAKVSLGGKSAAEACADRTEAQVLLAQAVEINQSDAVKTLRAACGYR